MTLDDNIRAALVGAKKIDNKLSSVIKITDQNIQFVPASKSFESESTILKSKYIYINATFVENGNSPHSNAVNRKLDASSMKIASTSSAYNSDPSTKCNGPQVPPPQFQIYPPDSISVAWEDSMKLFTGVGLNNLGNTCFLNSVLQVLSNTPPLVNYIFSGHHEKQLCPDQNGYCAVCALKNHISRVFVAAKTRTDSISPQNIVHKLRCVMKSHTFGRQQDAHEFLRYFVDALQNASLFVFKDRKLDLFTRETTPIGRIFGGFHKNDIICLCCRSVSTTFDPFMDICLEIKQFSNIEASLQHFTRQETLSSENAYKCPKCNRKVSAHKSYTINVPPNILTLQLKRFDHMGKIDKFVAFQEKLNLRPYMSQKQGPPVLYKLYGVVIHSGRTTNSGHYFAFVRNPLDQWHLMDDSRVCTVNTKSVLQTSAYVLFYVRIQPQTATVKPQPKLFPQPHQPQPIVETNGFSKSKPVIISFQPVNRPVSANGILSVVKPLQMPPVQAVAPLAFVPRSITPASIVKNRSLNGNVANGDLATVSLAAAVNEKEHIPSQNGAQHSPYIATYDVSKSPRTKHTEKLSTLHVSNGIANNSAINGESDSYETTQRMENGHCNLVADESKNLHNQQPYNRVENGKTTSAEILRHLDNRIVNGAVELSDANVAVNTNGSSELDPYDVQKVKTKKKKRHRSRSKSPDKNHKKKKSEKHMSKKKKIHDEESQLMDNEDREKIKKRKRHSEPVKSQHRRSKEHDRENGQRHRDLKRGIADHRRDLSPDRKRTRVESPPPKDHRRVHEEKSISRKSSSDRRVSDSCNYSKGRTLSLSPKRDVTKLSKKEKRREEKRRQKKLKRQQELTKRYEESKLIKVEPPKPLPSLMTPLEFLKRCCSSKVMTWNEAKPEMSGNFLSKNDTCEQVSNDRDAFNEEYDRGRTKKVKKNKDYEENMDRRNYSNLFQKKLDFKNKNVAVA